MAHPEQAGAPPYLSLLQQLKTCFPVPVSDPVMDSYFVHLPEMPPPTPLAEWEGGMAGGQAPQVPGPPPNLSF